MAHTSPVLAAASLRIAGAASRRDVPLEGCEQPQQRTKTSANLEPAGYDFMVGRC